MAERDTFENIWLFSPENLFFRKREGGRKEVEGNREIERGT